MSCFIFNFNPSTASGKSLEVVAALIFREGRLLACQRRGSGEFPLKWEFPGGKVEEGESDIDALRRELREELGIAIHQCTEIFVHSHSYPQGPEVRLKFFRVEKYEGEVTNIAFQQISWVKIHELSGLDFLAGDRPLIEKLLSAEGDRF